MKSNQIYINGGQHLVTEDLLWTLNNTPAAAAQATATKAAGAAGVSHVAKRLTAWVSTGAAAQTPVNVVIRDGASGAGTILFSASVACVADGFCFIDIDNLHLVGTAATAMTVEFSAAGVAASQEVVNLQGYDVSN